MKRTRLATFVLLAAMGASMLDYLFKTQAVSTFGRGPSLSRFLNLYYAITAVLTFFVQMTLSPWWLKRFGPGRTVAALPLLRNDPVDLAGLHLAVMDKCDLALKPERRPMRNRLNFYLADV